MRGPGPAAGAPAGGRSASTDHGGSRDVCNFQWPKVCNFRWPLTPSKVLHLSPRAARLYLMRLDEPGSGFAVARQLTARTRPHCRFVFLRSWVCLPLPSASPRGYALRFG